MLAKSQYARPVSTGKSAFNSRGNIQYSMLRFTRARVPKSAITRVRVPIHHSYVAYAPVIGPTAVKSSLFHTLFGTWMGRIIIGLVLTAIVTAIVVGTVVPLTSRTATITTTTAPNDEIYYITFNASNYSIPAGKITNPTALSYLQQLLDYITARYAPQIAPCRLRLIDAEATSDGRVITATKLDCTNFCTGTCSQQKGDTLENIVRTDAQTFVITNYPSSSNTSRRLARSVLSPEQNDKVAPGTIIDGRRVVGTNGLVTAVSFYADQSCIGHSIRFGAFEMNHHEGIQAEFTVMAESNPIIISQDDFSSFSSSENKLKLISITFCVNDSNEDISNERACRGVQFPIKSEEYFGSFSMHCELGSISLDSPDDAHTYVNRDDQDTFTKPTRRLRYTSLGQYDVLQVPTISTFNENLQKGRKQPALIMQSPPRVIFLGTYPPRGCGLATFLHDVIVHYDEQFHTNSSVIAIDEKTTPTDRVYPSRVVARLNQTERDSHLNIAKFINELKDVDVLNIQHEFGLYGGQAGEWILHLISSVRKPVLVTFHTVLQDPASIYYSITRAICSAASGVIVLSYTGRDILVKVYQIDINKIHVVPHGIPDVPFSDTLPSKQKLDLGNRVIMGTFGLIGRSKGLEYAIRMMKLAVQQVPDLLYIILGATHPVILKEVGEEYRNELQSMINNLSLSNNIKLVNKYLDNKELLTYLSAVDIYLTPYPNPDQIVSGTLSIAVGCGKAVVSTPYIYAKELLSRGRGFLIPFKDDIAASQTIVRLATDRELRDIARRRAYKYGRKMIWSRVVIELARIYENTLLDV